MTTATEGDAGYSPLPFHQPDMTTVRRDDGSILMTSGYRMPAAHRSIAHLFVERAGQFGDRPMMARRVRGADGSFGEWRYLTFAEALRQARSVAQAMIDRGMGQDSSIMCLSSNGLEHGVMLMAAMLAGVPAACISTGYSLLSSDHAKLKHCAEVCRPTMVFAEEGDAYARALDAIAGEGVELVTVTPHPGRTTTAFADLCATPATGAVDERLATITPDTVARYVFTSGSTGLPKGVIINQRMMAYVIAQHDGFFVREEDGEPGAYLSWLPWSHMGGSIVLLSDIINEAACLFIDDGKPMPGYFEESIRNLRELSLNNYSAPPVFYGELVKAMDGDPELRDTFFRKLKYFRYGSGSLSQDIFDRLQAHAIAATGHRLPMTTTYGTTETQGITMATRPIVDAAQIGTPFPGIELKLTPVGDKLEIRMKGDGVTPGYLRNPEATAKAFDEEGYYCTGDAARLFDPEQPELGLLFDGRISENFKLSSGTWVSVNNLRVGLIEHMAPAVLDMAIAGHDRDYVAVLIWFRPAELAAITGQAGTVEEQLASAKLAAFVRGRLAEWNAHAGGSSMRVKRAILLAQPPAPDEIADKGYVNQRAVLTNRADKVKALYAEPAPAEVIVV